MDTPGRITEIDVGTRPCYPGYEVFVFNFHRFASLPTRKGYSVKTSKATFFGHEWWLELYPGGDPRAQNGMMSVFVRKAPKGDNNGKGIALKVGINVRGFNGAINYATNYWSKGNTQFNDEINSFGWINYMKYADIRNPSNNFLANGTLSIVLELKFKGKNNGLSSSSSTPVIPPNSCNSKMLALWHQDVEYMDVSFVFPDKNNGGKSGDQNVNGYDPPKCDDKLLNDDDNDKEDSKCNTHLNNNEEKEEPNCGDQSNEEDVNKGQPKNTGVSSDIEQTRLYAHRAILKACAPNLFELCEFFGKDIPVPISNVEPRVFFLLLSYIYGLGISPMDWRQYSKDLLDAADCYGVSGLKLEAEAWYVKHTPISTENVIDLLSYAEAKNCALLKENVMDFFVKNRKNALKLLKQKDIPGSQNLFTDLLLSMNTGNDESDNDSDSEEYTVMRVTSLRRKLLRLGLDIDGSRETLVKRLEDWKENFGGGDSEYERDTQGISECAVEPGHRGRAFLSSDDDDSSDDTSSSDGF